MHFLLGRFLRMRFLLYAKVVLVYFSMEGMMEAASNPDYP